MRIPRIRRFRVTTLALLSAVAALVVQQVAGQVRDSPYSYFFEGRLVVLEASPDLIAVRADAPEPPAVEGARWQRDRLSERGALRDTGFVLYRLRAEAVKNKARNAPTRSAVALARDAGVALQPVFELGGAVKIPSDEVIVAFAAETDLAAAESALGARGDLGVLGVRPLMKNTFIVTISSADDGRAFAVSRDLSLVPGVAYAEPNFVVVMHPAPPVIRPGAFVPDLGPATELQESPAGPAAMPEASSRSQARPHFRSEQPLLSAQPAWTQLLHETFESGAPGWTRQGNMPSQRPSITTYRAVAGTHSAYMSPAAPGPYPNNSLSWLFSPSVNLSGYEEAYVELWFYAKIEDPYIDPSTGLAYLFDEPDVFLYQPSSGASIFLEVLAVAYTGDLTADPTTYNGWRHVVARVPPAWRANGIQVVVQFTSDSSVNAEGVYLDEVWVGGTYDVDSEVISNDTYSARQYELRNSGQIAAYGTDANDLNAPEAWAVQPVSPGIVLAIVDEGVEPHPDLNLVTGYNGATGGVGGGPTSPEAAHGQACAGNAGAVRNNGTGVVGTAPGVKIMPVNFGSTDADVANAINLAVAGGAHVLSNSWGWVGAPSATIQSAIVNALNAGRVVLFAAGNGPDREPWTYQTAFPCNLTATTSVICVGATGLVDDYKGASSSDGQHYWGSSYIGAGPDVMAPGPWSYTTDRVGALGYNTDATVTGVDYNYTHDFGGTSSSTPKVAGIAALVLSANPGLSPAQVKSILQSTAHDIDTPGPDDRTGYGRVDARAAVLAVPPAASISDAAVAEGALGTATELTLTVSLSFASGQAIMVDYAIVAGTATANSDYLPHSGKLYLPAGTTSRAISVAILGDSSNEANETFSVVLSNPSGATILDGTGIGTIINDDAAGFSIDDVAVLEPAAGTTAAVFTVTLSPASAATVSFTTVDGTATASGDYAATSGVLTFSAVTPTQTVSVPVNADAVAEGIETFSVSLSGSSGPALVRSLGTGSISDLGFYTVSPCRLVDTRVAGQGAPALTAGVDRVFALGTKCGLPSTATAVSFNITVTGTTGGGNLRLWKAGTPMPLVSAINWSAGQTRANNAIIPLSSVGQVAVRAQGSGVVDVILDVNGFFE